MWIKAPRQPAPRLTIREKGTQCGNIAIFGTSFINRPTFSVGVCTHHSPTDCLSTAATYETAVSRVHWAGDEISGCVLANQRPACNNKSKIPWRVRCEMCRIEPPLTPRNPLDWNIFYLLSFRGFRTFLSFGIWSLQSLIDNTKAKEGV